MSGTFESARLVLEPLTEAHLAGLVALFDPSIWRWYSVTIAQPQDLERFLREKLRDQAAGKSLSFAIRERASGALIGSSSFLNLDAANRRLEIGATWYAVPWQRTFANTEAKLLMLTHAFEQRGCVCVQLQTDVLNEASRRAILRLGAQQDGILRAHRICEDGRIRDSVFFSILATEWPAVRERLVARLARG